MKKENLSISQIRKLEKKKEKEVYKEREKELFYKLRCLILNIDELIDVMLEDEGALYKKSEYVKLDTDGLIDVTEDNLDYAQKLKKEIYNNIEKVNQIKIIMGLNVYNYPDALPSFTSLKVKMNKTKYVVTHLKSDEKYIYTMKVKVKKHKHDFKHMLVVVIGNDVQIKLK